MPQIPLCLHKITLYFLKYNCICLQIPLYYPKYHYICQKYHCVFQKYHCICSNTTANTNTNTTAFATNTTVFFNNHFFLVYVPLFSHFEVKCSPPFWTFFSMLLFLSYSIMLNCSMTFARLNDDIHNYQYDFL